MPFLSLRTPIASSPSAQPCRPPPPPSPRSSTPSPVRSRSLVAALSQGGWPEADLACSSAPPTTACSPQTVRASPDLPASRMTTRADPRRPPCSSCSLSLPPLQSASSPWASSRRRSARRSPRSSACSRSRASTTPCTVTVRLETARTGVRWLARCPRADRGCGARCLPAGTNLEGPWSQVMAVIGECHAAVHAVRPSPAASAPPAQPPWS